MKEISNTKLLVSLHHNDTMSANMEIFDLSQKAVKKIYAFEEVHGGILAYYHNNTSLLFLMKLSIDSREPLFLP